MAQQEREGITDSSKLVVKVSMANSAGLNFDQHFPSTGGIYEYILEFRGFTGTPGNYTQSFNGHSSTPRY